MSKRSNEALLSSSPFVASGAVRSIHRTLHLLYHHNKNQHRATKWWRWLDMLRRWTLKLACEIEKIETFEDVSSGDGDKDEHPFAAVWKIMAYLRDELVPRCYRAFSTVVADLQFTSLGVVLITTLAEVFKVVQINTDELSRLALVLGNNEVESSVEITKIDATPTTAEDYGEVITRSTPVSGDNLKEGPAALTESVNLKKPTMKESMKRELNEEPSSERLETTKKKEKKKQKEKERKKKKRKGNAIDDIFAGL